MQRRKYVAVISIYIVIYIAPTIVEKGCVCCGSVRVFTESSEFIVISADRKVTFVPMWCFESESAYILHTVRDL